MRRLTNLVFVTVLLTANSFGGMITTVTTSIGADRYRISYHISGFDLLVNQEIDIRFDFAEYVTLSNPVAPVDFDTLLLQPNNPPGAFGDFSLVALSNHPPLTGPFSVEVLMYGGLRPNSQPYSINQLDQNRNIVSVLATGDVTHSPEPSSALLMGAGLLAAGAAMTRCRRSR